MSRSAGRWLCLCVGLLVLAGPGCGADGADDVATDAGGQAVDGSGGDGDGVDAFQVDAGLDAMADGSDAAGDGSVADSDADSDADADSDTDAVADSDADSDAGTDTDAVGGPADTSDAGSGSGFCAKDSACNARLDALGHCPGQCIEQKRGAWCPGEVRHGLCYDGALPTPNTSATLPGGLVVQVAPLPAQATVDQSVTVQMQISNPSSAAQQLSVKAVPRLPAWKVEATSYPNPGTVSLPAGGALTLSTTLRPDRATVFNPEDWVAFHLQAGTTQLPVQLPVGFGVGGVVACGGHTFPKNWCKWPNCSGHGDSYASARCCGGVLYPTAQCCDDSDCGDKSCFDGRCVGRAPDNNWAVSPAVGVQRVLVLAADLNLATQGADVCTPADAALIEKIWLHKVAQWWQQQAQARTGKPAMTVQWHLLVVPDSSLFAADPTVPAKQVLAQAEAWLQTKGCVQSFATDFDRVLLLSSKLKLPAPGTVVGVGSAAALSYSPHTLLAHELGHLYGGADDLYLTSGGELQWRSALMAGAKVPGGPQAPLPSDAVLWGAVGWGDVDRDGVIDIFQWPLDPVALKAGPLSATLHSDRLAVVAPLVAVEPGGDEVTFRVPTLQASLPEHDVVAATLIGHVLTFKHGKLDLNAIAKAGTVKVRLQLDWSYTRSDGQRVTLSMDQTQTVKVILAPGTP